MSTSRITPSMLTVPSGKYNISYTRPRDSFYLPDPMFPPLQLSWVSGETTEGDAQPGMINIPPSAEHREPREPCFQDTVRGGQSKLHREKDFSPVIPPAAPHSTFNSPTFERLGLVGKRMSNLTSERFGRSHSELEPPSSPDGVV